MTLLKQLVELVKQLPIATSDQRKVKAKFEQITLRYIRRKQRTERIIATVRSWK